MSITQATSELTRADIAQRLFVNGKPADARTINRVLNAKPRNTTNDPVASNPKPFSLLK